MKVKNLRIGDVDKLLETFNIKSVPDVVKLAKEYDFKVITMGYEMENTGVNVKGYIWINDKELFKSKRVIAVRDDLSYSSKRFISAYLFSLYQLKGNDDNFVEVIYDESMFDEDVYNYTLDLLLPNFIFNNMYKNIQDRALLKEVFKVSDIVIGEKLKKLEKENRWLIWQIGKN